jgi:hypothetical protein
MRDFVLLLVLLFIKAALVSWLIFKGGIGLGPDEAQYWTWSQDLALGYYSKPPGIAWQIWFGTKIFGNTEFGVRFGALLIGILLPLAVFALARACGLKPQTSFWAGLVMALCPLGVLSSFLAITDGGMVFFWTVTSALWADALRKEAAPNYLWVGLSILCGALFKWPIYYFWVVAIISVVFYPFLWNRRFFLGLAISLLGLLPSVLWNAQHDWATFRHVFSTVHHEGGGSSAISSGNFWAFIGEQAVLLSPLLFILLIIALIRSIFKDILKPSPIVFCGVTFTAVLIIFSLLALVKKMQGNWCDFIYPLGIVFLCWFIFEGVQQGKAWLQAGVALAVLVCAFVFSIPTLQRTGTHLFGWQIPYKWNPFRHNVGWDAMQEDLQTAGYRPGKAFLFGDKYQISSLLSFYSEGQKRAYFLNLQGIRHNQFSFWPSMAQEQLGRDGYFVLAENSPSIPQGVIEGYQKQLQQYFREARFISADPIFFSYGKPVKIALIFHCLGYNGKMPPESNLY